MSAPGVAVAYSGGRDSSALLHATLASAADLGLTVLALHVHHGLSTQADAWLEHCERQCRRWAARGKAIRFAAHRLSGQPGPGDSVEAWARHARYAALREMALAHEVSVVLLAHHREDQAETVLLQALRGGGVAGLAAMPISIERAGVTWLRPWLDVPRAGIAAYVRKHRLRHIEDASNADPRFARNRLRLQVWPALQAAFPLAAGALADTARWAHEARVCAADLAAIDLGAVSDAAGLNLEAWSQLSAARRSNALRAWLETETSAAVPASLVQRLLVELPGSAPAQWLLGNYTLRRFRSRLSCSASPATAPAARPALETVLDLRRAGSFAMPGWGGCLQVRRVREGGVALQLPARLRLAARRGGEQFQLAPGRPPRSLKKQFQALALPAWQRGGPLVYAREQLLYVPGLGVDARALAQRDTPQWSFAWLAEPRA